MPLKGEKRKQDITHRYFVAPPKTTDHCELRLSKNQKQVHVSKKSRKHIGTIKYFIIFFRQHILVQLFIENISKYESLKNMQLFKYYMCCPRYSEMLPVTPWHIK